MQKRNLQEQVVRHRATSLSLLISNPSLKVYDYYKCLGSSTPFQHLIATISSNVEREYLTPINDSIRVHFCN
jgi:hypothetical protein